MVFEAYHPSIFFRTPQEHLEYHWRKNIQLPPAIPERHARVYVFPEWQEGRDDKELIQSMLYLKADVPLEPSGNLSLVRIRAMWGLEKCVPIDPHRRIPFMAANQDYLSPLAVQVLSDKNGVLKLYEPKPSEATLAMREQRMHYVRKYQAETTWLYETAFRKLDEVFSSYIMVVIFVFLIVCTIEALHIHQFGRLKVFMALPSW